VHPRLLTRNAFGRLRGIILISRNMFAYTQMQSKQCNATECPQRPG
jgi:hypothetical protein